MSNQAVPSRGGKQKQNTMFGGVAILAVGIAIVKLIGALFKIPLFNILGEKGSADFYNAYSIYSVLLTISTAGLPVALSKTVSEANTLGRQNQKQQVFRVAMSAFLAMGTASFLLMWFGSDWLADLLNNSQAAMGIKALAPAVICVTGLSAFRGYAQGHMNMTPTSVSQIIEALCKLFLGLALASYVMGQTLTGEAAQKQTSMAAAGAIVGVTAGTVLALAYMAWDYFRTRSQNWHKGTDKPDSSGTILANLLRIALPITVSTSLVPLISLIDNSLVQGQLQDALGMTEEASRALYGNLTVAMSLYNLPSSFMTAFTASIIPAVSARMARRDRLGAGRITGSVLRITALLAMPMGMGLTSLAAPIMRLLYPGYDVNLTAPLLAILGPGSILVCLVLVTNSILQAYGFVYMPVVTTAIGGVVKIVLDYVLVAIPSVNITGAPIGSVACYAVCLLLNLIILRRGVKGVDRYSRMFLKPAVASCVMGVGAWAVYGLLEKLVGLIPFLVEEGAVTRMGSAVATFGAIGVAVVIYLILVLALRIVSRDDVMLMPKGEKIAKLLRL